MDIVAEVGGQNPRVLEGFSKWILNCSLSRKGRGERGVRQVLKSLINKEE